MLLLRDVKSQLDAGVFMIQYLHLLLLLLLVLYVGIEILGECVGEGWYLGRRVGWDRDEERVAGQVLGRRLLLLL